MTTVQMSWIGHKRGSDWVKFILQSTEDSGQGSPNPGTDSINNNEQIKLHTDTAYVSCHWCQLVPNCNSLDTPTQHDVTGTVSKYSPNLSDRQSSGCYHPTSLSVNSCLLLQKIT